MKSARYLCLISLLFAGVAFAAGEDLERCLYNNGAPMPEKVCAALRKNAQQEGEKAARFNEWKARDDGRRAAEQEAAEKKRAQAKAEDDERARLWQEQRDRERAESKKAQDEQRRWEQEQERAQAAKERELKSACGEDYRSPKVGMTIERAQECVAPFKLTGQINRADGVVSTYSAGRMHAHVMQGRIVAWFK